jgi:hypothetical protein
MKKRYIYSIGVAIVTVIVLAIILVSDSANNSQYGKYKQYANQVGVVDWSISEDTAKSFAEANCDKLAIGDMPAIKFKNENHVKSSASVFAAYCPASFDNFLAGIITDYPQYKETALYINEELHVDSS